MTTTSNTPVPSIDEYKDKLMRADTKDSEMETDLQVLKQKYGNKFSITAKPLKAPNKDERTKALQVMGLIYDNEKIASVRTTRTTKPVQK